MWIRVSATDRLPTRRRRKGRVSKLMTCMKFVISLFMVIVVTCEAQTAPLPQIRQNGAVKQLFVDDKPFIMLSGELHNSSPSSIEYMRPIWDKLAALHLNTVIGAASWELVEPKEGKFDFSLVDDQINQARQRNMRLVLIWFATWKNAVRAILPNGSRQIQSAFRPWSSGCGPMAE
jgi:purine nucleoside phosphorylase